MRLTTLGNETDLGALADRLFPCLNQKLRQRAEAALLKVNPQLSSREAFRAGLVLNVPDIPGLNLDAKLTALDPVGDTLSTVAKAVQDYGVGLLERLNAAHKDAEMQVETLRQDEVLAAVAQYGAADLQERLGRFLEQTASAIDTEASDLDSILKRITDDLDAMR